jgi:hypothetical protein
MKPENSEKVIELLNTKEDLKQLQKELYDCNGYDLDSITIKNTEDIKHSFDCLTIGNLNKIHAYLLDIVEQEIEEIDKELEKL